SAQTFLQDFQTTSYATDTMGKWGLSPVGSTKDPNKKELNLFFGYNYQAVAHSYYPATLWRNAKQEKINDKPIPKHSKPIQNKVRLKNYTSENYTPSLMIDE